jgi:hypothetical protein
VSAQFPLAATWVNGIVFVAVVVFVVVASYGVI